MVNTRVTLKDFGCFCCRLKLFRNLFRRNENVKPTNVAQGFIEKGNRRGFVFAKAFEKLAVLEIVANEFIIFLLQLDVHNF